jgi:hypothetical protein
VSLAVSFSFYVIQQDPGGAAAVSSPADEDGASVSGASAKSGASAESVLGTLLDAAYCAQGPMHHTNRRAHLRKRNREIENEEPGDATADSEYNLDHGEDASVLSLLDHEDAVHPLGNPSTPNAGGNATKLPGRPVGRRRGARSCLGKLLSIVEFDIETRKIYKLAIPYFFQALSSGIAENGVLVVLGQLVGTRELAAFAIVDLLVGLTSQTIGSFMESLTPLLSFSRGTENGKLTGEYVQLALIFTIVFTVPFMFLWGFITDDVMKLFGFDDITAEIGQSFALPYLWSKSLQLVTKCFHSVMNVHDLEVASAVVLVIAEVLELVAVLIFALFWNPSLRDIGLVFVAAEFLCLLVTLALIGCKGWFRPFYHGFFRSFALKVRVAS